MTAQVARFGALQRRIAESDCRRALNAAPEYRAELAALLDALPLRPDDVLSLDIFDTLLLRCGRSELRRFWETGAAMAAAAADTCAISSTDAFIARDLGTRATYRASPLVDGCREGCLSEVHLVASRMLAGDERLHARFVEAELAYEARTLTASALLDEAERHRGRGGEVVLVTDMYMRETHVRRLLALLGIDAGLFSHVFSSADHKLSKASGGIFALIEQTMGRRSDAFVHVGDSLAADFRRPIASGWRAIHLPIARAERRRRLEDHVRLADEIRTTYGFTPEVAPPS